MLTYLGTRLLFHYSLCFFVNSPSPAVVLHDYIMKLAETSFLKVYGGNVVCVPVFLFFFTTRHSHFGGHQHFSFSHCSYEIFMFFFQRNWILCFFLSLTLSHSPLFRSMQTLKFSRKKESASLLLSFFVLSKSPGGHAIYRQNARAV